jgi:hypothetical protein
VSGLAFDAGLGLKSTLFTLTAGTADVAPPPPPPGEGLQALPEDLAASAPTAAGATLPDFGDLAGRPDAITASSVGDSDAPRVPLSIFAVVLNVSAAAVVGRRFVRRRA